MNNQVLSQPFGSPPVVRRSSAGDKPWQALARLLLRDRAGVVGLLLVGLVICSALFAPWLAPHDPLQQELRSSRLPPAWLEAGDWSHPLGTDTLGRDLYSRILYGARVSLTVGFFGALIAGAIGLVVGLIAGYVGGRVDGAIMTVVNIILALPYLLFVVVIAGILGRSLFNVILIFGITDAPIFVRVVRGEVLRLRRSVYVEAAQSVGVQHGRILFQHILPNLLGPFLTVATFEMSAMILYEAGLGFLGLSVPPEVPSWGNMLEAGRQHLQRYWWIATFPGIAIMIASLGMNLLGDWLRDVLDPRLRRIQR
jgi:ABC-type dipeptide/oligopeptide/nickel transport system permease subunit